MQYYNSKGRRISKLPKKETVYYKNTEGRLKEVPKMTDPPEEVIDYLHKCIREKHSQITTGQILEIWDREFQKIRKIIDYLEVLEEKYNMDKDRYRKTAYSRALRTLRNIKIPIMSGAQAEKLPGIGSSIGKKIDEILKTGGLRVVDSQAPGDLRRKRERRETISLFKTIWGVGDAQANKWYKQGYRSLEEIRGKLTTKPQKITYEFRNQLSKKVPREKLEYLKPFLEVGLYAIDDQAHFLIAGSYRRGFLAVKDLDILISSKMGKRILEEYIDYLETEGTIITRLKSGDFQVTALIQLNGSVAKADFVFIPWDSWATGVLAWTGSKDFVISMRTKAARMGYKLSRYSLTKSGKRIPTPTEKSIFKALGMKYIPPEKRF